MINCNFTDLVLLIGTNPLPNYVVAKYFLKNNSNLQRIWLVHTEERNWQRGTREFAQYLRGVLKEKLGSEVKHVKFNEVALSDAGLAKSIVEDIRSKLLEDFLQERNTRRMHMNYTGGTKAMAVHVYRALEQEVKDRCSFSYLDARKFTLIDDDTGDITGDLREEIDISLNNLIKLHGCRKEKREERKEKCTEEKFERFREVVKINDYAEFKEQIKGKNLGFCLERYVNEVLTKKAQEDEDFKRKNITVEMNWNIYNRDSSEKNFELDLIILNGYQVCCISCGTALGRGHEEKLKLKGMEVIHRANQIGGDESRAVLVTCVDDVGVRRISDDLMRDTGSTEKKLKVLGKSHLQEDVLWQEIKEYIFD